MLRIFRGILTPALSLTRQLHSNPTAIVRERSIIHVIPAGMNNYMFVIADNESNEAVVVDPVDADQLSTVVTKLGLKLRCVLTTHYLLDCAGGNRETAFRFPTIPIIGGDKRVQNITKLVGHGEIIKFGPLSVKCLLNPKESSGHVIYVVRNELAEKDAYAFVGDALSIAGFGNFLESHKRQVYKILTEDIGNLRDDTEIYCGRECAIQNLCMAKTIEPWNTNLQKKLDWAIRRREKKNPTVPSYFHEEKQYNPFLRLSVPDVQVYFGTSSPQETLSKLRKKIIEWKSRSIYNRRK